MSHKPPSLKLTRQHCTMAADVLVFVSQVIENREKAYLPNTLTARELRSLRIYLTTQEAFIRKKGGK